MLIHNKLGKLGFRGNIFVENYLDFGYWTISEMVRMS